MYVETIRDVLQADQLDALHCSLYFTCDDLAVLAARALRVALHRRAQLVKLIDLVPAADRGTAEVILRSCTERIEAVAAEARQVLGGDLAAVAEQLEQAADRQ